MAAIATDMSDVTEKIDVTACPSDVLENTEANDVTPFNEQYPVHTMIYVCLLLLVIPIGTFGNILILGAHACYKKLRKESNVVIINLALSDLTITAFVSPICGFSILKGEEFFDNKPILCRIIASLCLNACFTSFFSLFLVTVTQYLFVCHNKAYYKVVCRRRIIAACVFSWCLGPMLEFPNYTSIGNFVVDIRNHQCVWTISSNYSYIVGLCGLLLPVLITMFAHAHMIYMIKKTKRNVLRFQADGMTANELFKLEWMETLRTCKTLLIVALSFLICWTPDVIVLLCNFQTTMSPFTHIWTTFMAHLRSSLNFWIYLALNRDLRTGFAIFMRLKKSGGQNGSSGKSNGGKSGRRSDFSSLDKDMYKSSGISSIG